jgi:hypothetical protein
MSRALVDARTAQFIFGYGGPQCSVNGLSASCGLVERLMSMTIFFN